jgi:probable HAF family extracellular repeat protein
MISRLTCVASTALVLMAISIQLAAQDPQPKHHHYKLIDLGTFGGPQNYINGYDFFIPYQAPARSLNNAGTLTGWADTSAPDPYPNFSFNPDEYVSHAFVWNGDSVTDLGVLPNGASSATSWISTNGLIVGASQNGELDPLVPGQPEVHAVLWRDQHIVDLGSLPGPEGGYESGAQAVNSRGQVIGWALNTVPDPYSMAFWSNLYNWYTPVYLYQERAFLWQNGVMQDLGTLGTGNDAYAMAINEQGQVIGISYTNSAPNQVTTPCSINGAPIPTQDPFLWANGKMSDLGTLGGTCGFPSWINNDGHVVGYSDLTGDQVWHPFLWTKATGMQDLGTLGGNHGQAFMINERGYVVGGSTLEGDNQTDAFLWDGKMHDLGALNGCSYAFAINERAQVVGNWGSSGCQQGGFLWENGGLMVDLNTLVSSTTDLSVVGALNINDRGEIGGAAADVNGSVYAVLLIPCDEKHADVEGCDYSLVDADVAAQVSSQQTAHPLVDSNNHDRPIVWRKLLSDRLIHRSGLPGVRSPNN